MTVAGATPPAGPLVCPFVALAEDRDRRADAPDERNRCYAEKAPRRRDLAYQAQYCYSPGFAACSVFLSWAARNAAEPAYVTEAARAAWASGVAAPEAPAAAAPEPSPFAWPDPTAAAGRPADAGLGTAPGGTPVPDVDGGLFGPVEPGGAMPARASEDDWVSASAWASAPWDPDAEAEAEELVTLGEPEEEAEAEAAVEEVAYPPGSEEALQAPRMPAALPMRRRRGPQAPIRARGSGEWLYADPHEREPLVRRRGSVGPPILLAVLGLLVIALVVFMLPLLLGGGGQQVAALPTGSPGATHRAAATRAPVRTSEPSPSPSVPPEPRIRVHSVRAGKANGTLSGIADKYGVDMRLIQCFNVLTNPNLLREGQKLLIPPVGYACPPGWRRMTPPPIPE